MVHSFELMNNVCPRASSLCLRIFGQTKQYPNHLLLLNRGPQGGAFDKDLSYFRTILGSGTLVPGLECALRTMKPGGVRQVIVPYGPLSYPPEDKEHELVGPKPTTFSGMRALNFVLENERVDRTLLFNVKLIRVDRSDGKGGFIRG